MTACQLSLTLGLCSLFGLSACKTQRTVLAGPVVTSLDIKDSSNQKIGQADSGGAGFGSRFDSPDPFGYNQNASNKDGQGGLNAMSEKMFGGKLEAQSKKEYTSTKNFLTREYGGGKDFKAKDWKSGKEGKSSQWTDQLFATDENKEGAMTFREGSKEAATKENSAASKVAGTKDFAGSGKKASTKDYYPAEKALSQGRDNPKLANASGGEAVKDSESILQRIKNSQATSSDIIKMLNKD